MNGRIGKVLAKLLPGKRWGVIAIPYLWMLFFFAIPFLIVLRISFSQRDQTQSPPYTPIMEYIDNAVTMKLNLSHYVTLVTDSLYIQAYGSSLWIAAVSTAGPGAVAVVWHPAVGGGPHAARPGHTWAAAGASPGWAIGSGRCRTLTRPVRRLWTTWCTG